MLHLKSPTSVLLCIIAHLIFPFSLTSASDNFEVTPGTAKTWENVAEHWRTEWIKDFPIKGNYNPKAKLTVKASTSSGGSTTYVAHGDSIDTFVIEVQGTSNQISYSVIPHEVMHTVMATYMGKPTPRWADEGYATFVEQSDRHYTLKHVIPFSTIMDMAEYPPGRDETLNFYAQSTLMVKYLVLVKGKTTFRDFIYDYLHTKGDWSVYLQKYYNLKDCNTFEESWTANKYKRIIDLTH